MILDNIRTGIGLSYKIQIQSLSLSLTLIIHLAKLFRQTIGRAMIFYDIHMIFYNNCKMHFTHDTKMSVIVVD